MNRRIAASIIVFSTMWFVAGCSANSSLPISPDPEARVPVESACHALLGYYSFVCDPDRESVEFTAKREISLHLNAMKFLEPPPNLHLSLEGPLVINGNILDINIGLRNPYLGLQKYTGFDVCGIVFTRGSVSGFNDPDFVMAGEGDTRLLNADGFTRWWNPLEFPHTETIFGYKDGMLGTPAESADFNCTLNGYKYFADGLGPDDPLTMLNPANRGMFTAGQQNIRHYTIDLSSGLIFNYAVDACWAIPAGSPPYDVPGCFPDHANRPEAYDINVIELGNSLYYHDPTGICGGTIKLSIEIKDHFNALQNFVYCESLSGLDFTEAGNIGGDDNHCVYETEIYGIELTHNGPAKLLITVQSEAIGYGDLLPGKPVCAYFVYDFNISDEGPAGWARTWGSDFIAEPYSYPYYFSQVDEKAINVGTDSAGDIYVVGDFGGTVDFDDSEGDLLLSSYGQLDAYLTKYNPQGDFLWAISWGGTSYDRCFGLYIDGGDNIYVTGDYTGSVDFDPGPDSDICISHQHTYSDAYISKFDSDGQHMWTKVWGGTGATVPFNAEMDSFGCIYIVGWFQGSVDFDPGPGEDSHSGNPDYSFDAFILKLTIEGDYVWARTYGGKAWQSAIHLIFDSNNNLYVGGNFEYKSDFDPGEGEEIHWAHADQDAYISKFDPDGNFIWVLCWGGSDGYDQVGGLSISSTDEIFVCGRFVGDVDFDPSDGEDIFYSHGNADAFLCKYTTSGNYQWTRVWGGIGLDKADGMTINSADELFITGTFAQAVDFDPGPGEVISQSAGGLDTFLSKFDDAGILDWAVTWGGESSGSIGDRGWAIASIPGGNIYVAGMFEETCDFYPGPWHDIHASNGGTDAFLAKYPTDGNW